MAIKLYNGNKLVATCKTDQQATKIAESAKKQGIKLRKEITRK